MSLWTIQKSSVLAVSELPNDCSGKIIKLALAAMQPDPQNLTKLIDKLSAEKNIPKAQLLDVLSSYIAIIRAFIHSNDKDFIRSMEEIGFPSQFVDNLPFLNNKTELLDTFFAPHYNYLRNLSSIKWRIDMSLLQSSLVGKTSPNVVLSIKLKNGKLHVIELKSKTFHMLRFNIALILKEIQILKNNTLLNKKIGIEKDQILY